MYRHCCCHSYQRKTTGADVSVASRQMDLGATYLDIITGGVIVVLPEILRINWPPLIVGLRRVATVRKVRTLANRYRISSAVWYGCEGFCFQSAHIQAFESLRKRYYTDQLQTSAGNREGLAQWYTELEFGRRVEAGMQPEGPTGQSGSRVCVGHCSNCNCWEHLQLDSRMPA